MRLEELVGFAVSEGLGRSIKHQAVLLRPVRDVAEVAHACATSATSRTGRRRTAWCLMLRPRPSLTAKPTSSSSRIIGRDLRSRIPSDLALLIAFEFQ